MFPTWLLLCLLLSTVSTRDTGQSSSRRKKSKVKGDIILGALFPIHQAPTMQSAFTRKCGDIREQYGMHRVEVLLKTVAEINNNSQILPNITLGLDIRDTCWYAPVALEQSIDFIRNSLANLDRSDPTRISNNKCSSSSDYAGKPIAALIGPGSSQVTIQVQNLLQLFKIPQVGYSATSMDLSEKVDYPYFLRVVPSDKLQARVLLDIVEHFNWKYVSLLHSKGNYGERGMKEFRNLLANKKERDICKDREAVIDSKEGDKAYRKVARDLFNGTNPASVVICFCEGGTVNKLYQAMRDLNIHRKGYVIVGSDGWADRTDILGNITSEENINNKYTLSDLFVGGISVRLYSPKVPDFDDYWFKRSPLHNESYANPWMKEFWEQKFNCTFDAHVDASQQKCTGKEDLRANYKVDTKLGFVVNSVQTIARALHSLQKKVCGNITGICDNFLPVNGSQLKDHLVNVSFQTYSGNMLKFNKETYDPPGRYDIMNYQFYKTANGKMEYGYKKIATWDETAKLEMNKSVTVQWPAVSEQQIGRYGKPIRSVCSEPCKVGDYKVSSNNKACCWKCKQCSGNGYVKLVNDEESCVQCEKGFRPNYNKSGCVPLPIEFMKWDDTQAIVAVVFSCCGVFTTLVVVAVFIRHNNTAIVKASTRELMYMILAGLLISYLTSFFLIAKPRAVTCYISRILPGFSFALVYGALVTKTNRIARILAGSKKKIMTRKPRFLSTTSQILITCLLNTIECGIITAMLILEPPEAVKDFSSSNRVLLVCNTTSYGVIVPLGFDVVLIFFCTIYAIRTRNLPENFNEAKFIGFCMYTTCVIWLGFVPIYFGSNNKVIAMCLAMSLSASVALVLLFFPKCYIIVFKPEKNNRGAFATTKEVRCHIGTSDTTRKSSLHKSGGTYDAAEKNFEGTAIDMYRQKNFFERWRKHSTATATRNSNMSSAGLNAAAVTKLPTVSENDKDKVNQLSTTSFPARSQLARVRSSARNKDSECQTDEELLMTLLPTLRRRAASGKMGGPAGVCLGVTRPDRQAVTSTGSTHSSSSNPSFLSSRQQDSRHSILEEFEEEFLDSPNESEPLLPEMESSAADNSKGIAGTARGSRVTPAWVHSDCDSSGYYSTSGNGSSESSKVATCVRIQRSCSLNRDLIVGEQGPPPRISAPAAPHLHHIPHSQTEGALAQPPRDCRRAKSLSPSMGELPLRSRLSSVSHSSCSSDQGVSGVQDKLKSIEDMSVFGLKLLDADETEVCDFHDYLAERGLNLDLDGVEMSEV